VIAGGVLVFMALMSLDYVVVRPRALPWKVGKTSAVSVGEKYGLTLEKGRKKGSFCDAFVLKIAAKNNQRALNSRP
jgi:hypothetical protein